VLLSIDEFWSNDELEDSVLNDVIADDQLSDSEAADVMVLPDTDWESLIALPYGIV
jgi:hypothetical protein